jgi:hypothetical protein
MVSVRSHALENLVLVQNLRRSFIGRHRALKDASGFREDFLLSSRRNLIGGKRIS